MNILKAILNIIKKTIVTSFVILFLYLLVAFIFSVIPIQSKNEGGEKEFEIYIKTNGIHTDIVMPVKNRAMDWSNIFGYKNTFQQDFARNYISVGWGSKYFYLNVPEWSDVTPRLILSSISGFEDAVLHISYLDFIDESDSCIKIQLSNMMLFMKQKGTTLCFILATLGLIMHLRLVD